MKLLVISASIAGFCALFVAGMLWTGYAVGRMSDACERHGMQYERHGKRLAVCATRDGRYFIAADMIYDKFVPAKR